MIKTAKDIKIFDRDGLSGLDLKDSILILLEL